MQKTTAASNRTALGGIASASDKQPRIAYAWFVVGLLFLAALVSFLDRQVINLLVDPIKADLAITDTQISLLQGLAFALFYSAMALPMGWLADNWSRVHVIVVGMLLWSTATVLCGLAWSFSTLFLARMLVGVGEAALAPAGNSLIADYFPKEKVTRAISVFTSAAFIGVGVSLLFGGVVVSWVEAAAADQLAIFRGLKPWQITFIIAGMPGIFLAFLILFFVSDSPGKKSSNTAPRTSFFREAFSFLRLHWRSLGAIYFGLPLLAALQYGVAAWLPSYFSRSFDWSPLKIGTTYGLIAASFGFLGAISGGLLADLLRKRDRQDANILVAMMCAVLMAIFTASLGLSDNEKLSTVLLVFVTFFGSMPFGPGVAAITIISAEKIRAQMIAIYFLLANLVGLTLGPWIVAFFTDSVFGDPAMVGVSISFSAVLLSFTALLVLFLGRPHFSKLIAESENRQRSGQF